jgi:hypothetical protein
LDTKKGVFATIINIVRSGVAPYFNEKNKVLTIENKVVAPYFDEKIRYFHANSSCTYIRAAQIAHTCSQQNWLVSNYYSIGHRRLCTTIEEGLETVSAVSKPLQMINC